MYLNSIVDNEGRAVEGLSCVSGLRIVNYDHNKLSDRRKDDFYLRTCVKESLRD